MIDPYCPSQSVCFCHKDHHIHSGIILSLNHSEDAVLQKCKSGTLRKLLKMPSQPTATHLQLLQSQSCVSTVCVMGVIHSFCLQAVDFINYLNASQWTWNHVKSSSILANYIKKKLDLLQVSGRKPIGPVTFETFEPVGFVVISSRQTTLSEHYGAWGFHSNSKLLSNVK